MESATRLGSGATWQAVATTPTLSDGRWSVTIRAAENSRFFRLRQSTPTLTRIIESSPFQGETGVAVTRESILRLSAPLALDAVVDTDHFVVTFAGRRLLSRAEVSSDRQTVTLFYLENLPAAAHLSATFDARGIRDMAGNEVDANADGLPGGIYSLEFETSSLTGLPNTAVIGTVFASEKNADGSNHPLENVTVTVDGAEETLRATTDASGRFRLQPTPAGRFFVHVDGRTAVGSQWPNGAYYPVVGKAWEAVVGGTNNLAGGSGEVFLPLIQSDALQPVSAVEATRITFSPAVLAANPTLAGVELTVPPNALFGDNGTRGGKVGIAPVPPDRLPEPLPPGLNLPLVITVQTDGAANFDTPVPVKFPNVPDPSTGVRLGAGEKTVIWSFNHDTGRWEPQGTATISADGQFVVSDPGVGIRQPGWHGWFPGSPGSGPGPSGGSGPSGPPPCEGPGCECTQIRICITRHEGRLATICALSCLGNIWDKFLGREDRTPRSPIEDGLRCIGGPDKCPGVPEDVLTKKQRDCMDTCRFPETTFKRYLVRCEGYVDPCPENTNEFALHGFGPAKLGIDSGVSPLTPGFIPISDPLEEQLYIWAVEEEYLLRLTGTEKFVLTEVEEMPRMNTFLDLFSTYVGPASQSGIHLSPTERAELLAMPRPSQFTAIEWQVLIDRLDSLQGAALPGAVAEAKTRLDKAIDLLVSRGWKRRLDGLLDGFALQSRARAPELGSEAFPARPHYYYLKNHDTGFVQRGRLSPGGTFEGMILAIDSYYTVLYYDPVTRYSGAAFFKSRAAGVETEILTAPLEPFPDDQPDQDHDLVPDLVEQILGTNPDGADSDGDGTPDGAELASGTNPLDGVPVAIGVRMILDTPGVAVDVTSWNDLVAVADGSEGVALFDASNPTTPVRLAQIAIPGQSTAVAGSGDLLAVASGASGVAIYDVSNAKQPTRLSHPSLGSPSTSVGISGERVIAGLASGDLVLLDVFGEVLQRVSLESQIQDVLVRGDVVYAMQVGKLHVFTLADGTLISRGSMEVPGSQGGGGFGPRLRLTSDHARLFVTHTVGFDVLDLSDPLKPVLLRNVPTQQAGWKQIVPDGSGLAMGAVNANSTGEGPHDVSLFDVGPEGTNATLLTTFVTPGIAQAVSLHEGMAYVADGAFGMTVISYAAPDLFGKPPTVSLSAALRPGPTTQMSRESLRLAAFAQDDVRMRSVEFLLDGERVAKFAAPPYLFELRAPTISAAKTSFTLQARATDTGGNVALTPVQTVVLIPETVPPQLTQLNPTNDTTLAPLGFTQITARFSEPLLPSTFAGPALRLEVVEGDVVTPVPTSLRFSPNNERVEIVFNALPDADAPRRLRLTLSKALTDTSGNALEAPVVAEFNLEPVNRLLSGTDWGNAGNWSKGLPGPETPVVLGTANAPREIQLNPPFAGQAFSVVAHDALTLKSSLTLGDDAIFHQPLAFVGQSALIAGGDVQFRAGGEATGIAGSGALGAASASNFGQFLINKDSSSDPFQILGTTVFRNEAGATFDLRAGVVVMTAEGRFENHGRLTHDAATPALIASARLDNFGRLEVASGQLDLRGASQHFGVVAIAPGATLRFGNGAVYSLPTEGVRHFFAPSSRLEGAGNLVVWETAVHFAGPVDTTGLIQFESSRGSITFAGVTRLRRGLNLAGEFSNPFAGNRRGNDVTFSGLSAQIDQPVVLGTNSALTFDQAVPTPLAELDAGPTSRVQGKGAFSVLGKSKLNSASLLGSGLARFGGPTEIANLTVQGPNTPAAPKVVEFDGETSTKGTHFFRQTLLRVGSHGTLTLTGGEAWRRNNNPGFVQMENLGVTRQSGNGTTSFDFGFVNRGQFEVLAGAIVFPAGNGFTQEAGVTTLRGGTLNAEPIVRGGIFRLESGQFTGALTFFDGRLEFPPNATLPVELRVSGGILDLPESTLTVGLIRHTNGTLRLNGGTLVSLTGYAGQNPAVLTGQGTFDTGGGGSGEVRPGSPLGILTFTGSYSLDTGSRFVAEIGGLTPGTEFDQLRTSDLSVSSSATLDLRLVGGFSPPLGAEFPIIVVTNGRRAPRAFGTVEGLAIDAGKRFEVVYELAGVKVKVVAAP